MERVDVEFSEIKSVLAHFGLNEKERNSFRYEFQKQVFLKVRYRPRDIIMPRGVYSDYAGVLVAGAVLVVDAAPQFEDDGTTMPDCWGRPGNWLRGLEDWVVSRLTRSKLEYENDAQQQRLSSRMSDRIAALLSWFRGRHERRFVERGLADPVASAAVDHEWLDSHSAIARVEVPQTEEELQNSIALRTMGFTAAMWSRPRTMTLVADPNAPYCEMILVKRAGLLKLEQKCPKFSELKRDKFHQHVLPSFLRQHELFSDQTEIDQSQQSSSEINWKQLAADRSIKPEHFEKGERLCDEGEPVCGLSLIISGVVKATGNRPDGEALITHLRDGDCYGVGTARNQCQHTSRLTAQTDVHVVTIPTDVLTLRFFKLFPKLAGRLDDEFERRREMVRRAEQLKLKPPEAPSDSVVPLLMQARNLLRIDMDLCTRCDQCIVACADTHDGVSRFRRANPDLRIGKYEVAAACVHCINAPCQRECPVGAITFLESGAVHIHRSRCISCKSCVEPCPFDVIEMRPRTSPVEAPVADVRKDPPHAVATKCDLCLTGPDKEPPCVQACPYGAAQRGRPDQLFEGIADWLRPDSA